MSKGGNDLVTVIVNDMLSSDGSGRGKSSCVKNNAQERFYFLRLLEVLRRDDELLGILDGAMPGFGKLKHKLLWRILRSGFDLSLGLL